MKFICAPLLMLLMFTATVWGAGPGEDYVRIYSLILQGDTFERANHQAEAVAAYLEAQKGLERLQKGSPNWNPKVVDFRLRYVRTKVAELTPTAVVAPKSSSGTPTNAAVPAAIDEAKVNRELQDLRGELQQLRSENSSLQAKLREALSVRPTSVDPRELQLAEEKNLKLTKELALLKSDLSQATTNVATAPDSRELAKVQAALEQETRRADQLAADRAALASQVSALQASAAVAAALREENSLLKAQLAETRSGKATGTEAQQRRLDEMATELAMIRSEANILQLEKGALEARMQKLKNGPGAMGAANVSELSNSKAQISELERERTQLQLQLAQANQELANRSVVSVGEPSGQAQAEVDRLKARLAVYESEQIPYSVEELALFRMSKALSASNATRPMPPKDAGPLVAQAERQFQGGQFPGAEATLKEILHKDESNAFTLANLAATQMEQGKDAEAEVNLRNALATAPRDPFSLATMGILQFRKQHYEEALDYLGLATQYKPDDPVILNYLGMALSEKGMRGPAETALRRAIQLQPGFGDAHFNLALVYILQDPPLRELARWHYQKALEVGHPRSTETEQLLDSSGTN